MSVKHREKVVIKQQLTFSSQPTSPRRRKTEQEKCDYSESERASFFKSYLSPSVRKKRKEAKIFNPCIQLPGKKFVTSRKDTSESDSDMIKFDNFIHHHKPGPNPIITPKLPPVKNRVTILHNPKRSKVAGIVKQTSILPPNRGPPKVLIVFPNFDVVADNIVRAAEKLNFEVTLSDTHDKCLEEFQGKSHDLVIVDTRSSKSIDYETLCRSIRNTKGSQHTVLVAIVKKSAYDKDDAVVSSLLDAGYTRCIIETINLMAWVNELIQLKHSDIRPMAQYATSQTLFAALDKCKDIVFITDETMRLQYVNAAGEHSLGFKNDELIGKHIQETLVSDPLQVNIMNSHLKRGRDWHGNITFRRKNQDSAVAPCKAAGLSCAGRLPTHFVIIVDFYAAQDAAHLEKGRGSIPSIGRQSIDIRSIGSDYLRRSSVARLHNLPLEAPITKVIGLIASAQEAAGSNTHVVSTLDKVIDTLRSTELYTPTMKDEFKAVRTDEPVASDLIGALLTQNQPPMTVLSTSRRSSNDSQAFRVSKVSKIKLPAQVKDMLDHALEWSFDIVHLEEITNKRPLMYLGMHLFMNFDVPNVLECDEKTLYNWLTVMEANYHSDNWYHNSTHASDVMQAVAGFLQKDRLKQIMEPLDEAVSLISAAAHDLDHPGKSSAFLANSRNPLAILYNDLTVLESHHVALMFKLTLADDRINIFKNLDTDTYKAARSSIIDMILATEMTKHFEHLAKFVTVFCNKTDEGEELNEYVQLTNPENIILIKRIMIKCADVSNPTRSLGLCVEWAKRIAEEYFQQTDEEKTRGLPVVMPMFDRLSCSIPKAQIGFVDYIVHDMFEAWNAFIDMPELLLNMSQNYMKWKEFDENGYSTLADIRKLQNTVITYPSAVKNTMMKYDKVDE